MTKIIRQPLMPIPAILLTLLAILVNYQPTLKEMPPTSLSLFITLLYLLGWCFLTGICIKLYYRVVLFFYAVFWFASFLFCTIPALVLLFNARPMEFLEVTNVIFVAPVYGLHALCSRVMTMGIGATFSVILAIVCFLCVRRKSDSLPKPKRRRKQKPPKPPAAVR